MLAKCCNPECEAPFDYRQGRLIRFSSKPVNGKSSENLILIQHFWLCEKCAGLYVFEYESGVSVRIKLRHQKPSEENRFYFISTV
jgi:hypothetical protein